MGFFYFFPQHGGVELFREAGLAYAFRGEPVNTLLGPEDGPEGHSGTVFHDYPGPTLPKPIEWRRAGACWVGWHAAEPPRPETLRNGTFQGGRWWKWRLRDGHEWEFPLVLPCTARDAQRQHGLPTIYAFAGEGIGEKLSPAYAPLVAEAEAILREMGSDQANQLPPERVLRFCAALLGVAYRVGVAEVLALELLGREEVRIMTFLALDGAERVGMHG